MSNVKFSLVITNYNRAQFIDRAIRSCDNQLLLRVNYEIIVADDASTDDSMKVLNEFIGEKIRLFRNKKNRGVAAVSNLALENSRGKYWMRVDGDDFLNQYACAFMTLVLDENPDVDFVYTDHYRVDVHGLKVEKIRLDTRDALFRHGAGVMFRTDMLREIGGYDDTLRNAEDYDLLVRISKAGYKGFYLPVPLYRYYMHGGNLTLGEDRDIFIEKVKKRHNVRD